ncbi:Pycsar system effector family protein [Saccharothrix sp.]|uniref:Pycsar system effector family protein n=1 Tax=Saccharothrix sp. TaxID=1873460 RepID=UPI0028117A5E|nr:Pycsar system effector family protein [Saccharothrix sp.]
MGPQSVESAFADVAAQIGQANGKATGLLPLFGGAVVGVVALAARPMPLVAQVLLALAGACTLAAVLALLSVVRPQFTPRDDNGFPFAARFADRPSALLEALQERPGDVAMATYTVRLAQIVRSKYVRVRTAVDLIVVALLLVAVALTVMAVA